MAFTQFGHFEIHQPIFDFIMNGKSGYIICDPHARKLYFENGRLIYASSENEEDNYPRILVERGNLSEEQYKEIQASLTKGESFGRKVREMGLVEPKELALALKLQVTRVVDSVTLHKTGEYEVHEDELPQRMPRLKIQSLSLIGKSMLRIPGNELLPDLDPETNYRLHEDAEERAIELGVPKDLTEVFAFLKEHEWIQAEALQEFFDWDSDYLRKVLYFLIQLDIVEQDDSQDNILETEDSETDNAALITAASDADLLAEVLPESEPGTLDVNNAAPIYSEEEHHDTDDDSGFAIEHDTLPGKNVAKPTEAEEQESVANAFEDEDITDYTLQDYAHSSDDDDAELSDPLDDDDDDAELDDDDDDAELTNPLDDDDDAELSDPLDDDDKIDTLDEGDSFVEEDDGPSYRGTFDEASLAELDADQETKQEPAPANEASFADLNDEDDLDATVHDPAELGQPISDEFAPIDDFSGSVEPASIDELDESSLDTAFSEDLEDDEHDFSSLNQSIEEVTALDDDASELEKPYDPDTDSLFPDELEEAPSPFETGPLDTEYAADDSDIAKELRSAISDDDELEPEELNEDDLEELPSPSDEDMWNNPTVTSRDDLPDWSSYADQKEKEEAEAHEETPPEPEPVAQDFDPGDLVASKRPLDENETWDAAAPTHGVDTNPMPIQDPIEHPPVDTVIMPDPEDEPQTTSKKRNHLPAMLILVLVIIGAAGFYYWQNANQKPWQSLPPIVTDEQPTQSENVPQDPDQTAIAEVPATATDVSSEGSETVSSDAINTSETPQQQAAAEGTDSQKREAEQAANLEPEPELEPEPVSQTTPRTAEAATQPSPQSSTADAQKPEPKQTPSTPQQGYQDSMQQAVRTFQQEGARYSLTIVVACQSDTVDGLMAKPYADKLHVFPRQLGERSCYMVTWGIFQTKAEAIAARAELPDELRNRKDPAWVVDLDRYL